MTPIPRQETFEQFMTRCLHDPEQGYYSQNIRGIGSRGDFTTAPQLSEAPAKAIAAWARQAFRAHRTNNLIEIGPGMGTLAGQVLQHLPMHIRFRTKLHLVDSSQTLAVRQKAGLRNKANYHRTIQEALSACKGRAVIYSNELVDAFPVKLFEKTSDSWAEVCLNHSSATGVPEEYLCRSAELPPSSIFDQLFQTSQRVEIHDSYRLWLKSWLPGWQTGEMLTIDYGNLAKDLYYRRPGGSLRAYFHHQIFEGNSVYQHPGKQDITADVNFTDLIQWSKPWLTSEMPVSLATFIRCNTEYVCEPILGAADHFMVLRQVIREKI
ncbi:SAM-dependent methyltransferase [Luteolibacter algae]|uniref:SAM-dependent methyltransferase n=1 Tax=Luteolibacter algae TaxID=454151 RepID=A0ABW5D862_9BACT